MIVIDTSVVFKWFDENEENRDIAKKILENHLIGENEIIILDLFLYEITNAWTTKVKIDFPYINKNLLRLEKYSLNIIPVSFVLLKKASEFAKRYHVSVYDASYAILAKEKKCKLITADMKFVNKVNLSFINNLS